MTTLDGKVALVTGASRGIGAAVARMLAARGVKLGLASRSGEDLGIADALAPPCDVRDPGQLEEIVAAVVERFGRLDILVANAGVGAYGPFLDLAPNYLDEMIDVNLKGAYFLSVRAAAVMMGAGGGKIINISSVHDLEPLWNRAIYSISKGGLLMMVKSLALELAEYHICVNAISPGAILTDMNRGHLAQGDRRARHPFQSNHRQICKSFCVARKSL